MSPTTEDLFGYSENKITIFQFFTHKVCLLKRQNTYVLYSPESWVSCSGNHLLLFLTFSSQWRTLNSLYSITYRGWHYTQLSQHSLMTWEGSDWKVLLQEGEKIYFYSSGLWLWLRFRFLIHPVPLLFDLRIGSSTQAQPKL